MNKLADYIKELLKKFAEGDISASETRRLLELLALYEEEEVDEMLYEINQDIDLNRFNDSDWQATPFQELLDRINKASRKEPVASTNARFSRVIQVSLPIVLIGMIIWMIFYHSPLDYSCGPDAAAEIPTGRFSCMVTLASGCVVKVDSNYHGSVTEEGNIEITEPERGLLLCTEKKFEGKSYKSVDIYNAITVARGEQYRVILPDGSKVRLNAESSLRFLVNFKSDRRVKLRGEAFFDVTPNSNQPFIVETDRGQIEVHGTRFNVNAYSVNVITTLLDGKLQISTVRNTATLKSGQQTMAYGCPDCPNLLDSIIKISHPDTGRAFSWRRPMRQYSKIPFNDLIYEICRWYKLDIRNPENIPRRCFSGRLCFEAPLQDVLDILRQVGLKYKIRNRIIDFDIPEKGGG